MSEMTEEQKSAYDKLTPQRKALVDMVMKNLENGTGLWIQGWKPSGIPKSASTGKPYRGVNNIFLTLVSMSQGYSDNRWATFRQMEEKGWRFKTDEEGKSIGKGKGVSVEFFEFRDRETKKPFDRSVLDGMTADEKEEYMQKNIYPLRKYYTVFNGDLIDGIPEREKREFDPNEIVERAENILRDWDENESKIIYGGSQAYYRPSTDEIHLPEKSDFYSMQEFYSTALHEVGHSTGHEKRLNRALEGKFGTPEYALEELRAEIASMFLEQDLEISVEENHIQNNSAYIQSWHEAIKENPNALFTAIADADKISKFVMAKEKEQKKRVEHYAIVQAENAYGEAVYKVYMAADHGQTALAINYGFSSREALMTEFEKMQSMPFWADSEFREVSFDELEKISIEQAETKEVKEEKSEVYVKPSEIAAKSVKPILTVDMSERGLESLTRMSDRDVVEQASKTKNGEKFSQLYNGISVLGNIEKDERSLMARIAMYCNGDKAQLLRIFQSSGQYRDEKPNAFYEKMAEQSLQFVAKLKNKSAPVSSSFGGKDRHFGMNAKS